MNIFEAIFQGIVQGLTEFLPVSSSGHLSLIQHFMGQSGSEGSFFTIALHFGTLVAVFIAFWGTISKLILEFCSMVKDIFTGKFTMKNASPHRRMVVLLIVSLIPLLFFAFIKDFYTGLAEDKDIIVEGFCFLITGTMLMMADRCVKGNKGPRQMRFRDAVAIGIAQGIAPLPGISRSGSTISVGLMCGLSREYAVRFSFIMGIPAVLAANVLEFKDAITTGMEIEFFPLIIGMLAAAVFGFLAIKMVNWLVKSDKFTIFAYYTIALGILVIAEGIFEAVAGQNIFQFIKGGIA